MENFNRVIRRIAEENPTVAVQLREAFPDSFPSFGKFIFHEGFIDKEADPGGIGRLYFVSQEDTSFITRHIVKLDGTWSAQTSTKYPNELNNLFTGTLKVKDGVLVEVNKT